MPDSEHSVLADVQHEATSLAGELRTMCQLRWQLAQLELQSDAVALRRLAVGLIVGGLMILTSLPLWANWAIELLQRWSGVPRSIWLVEFAGVLLVLGIVLAWFSWRRFRRERVMLRETLEELREDIIWLEEWIGRSKRQGS